MAYTKTNWVNEGPPAIDADNLNHIEQGIYNNSLEINALKQDYIIEEGTSGSWFYRKWSSGFFEAWDSESVTFAITTQTGAFYIGNGSVAIPSEIGATSITYASVEYSGGEGTWTKLNSGTVTTISFAAISGVSRSSSARNFKIYVAGTYS